MTSIKKPTRILSEAAQTAAAIRKEIKAKMPGEKFRVRSENYAGGNSVTLYIGERIKMENEQGHRVYENEAAAIARPIVKKYQEGNFNSMEDIYEYDASRDDIPQVKFVFVEPLGVTA